MNALARRLEEAGRRTLRRMRGRPAFGGWIDVGTWVSDDVLLLLGWFRLPESRALAGVLRCPGREVPVELRAFSYPRPDVAGAGPQPGKVALARLAASAPRAADVGPLVLHDAGEALWIGPARLSEAITTTTNFGQRFSALEPDVRDAALEFLAETGVSGFSPAGDPLLRRNLFLVREAIRESLPAGTALGSSPELVVDALLAVDDREFCLQGWMRPGRKPIASVTVVSPDGERVDILDRLFRVLRPDVEGDAGATGAREPAGFRCAFELSAPCLLADGWTVEMREAGGATLEVPAPSCVSDPLAVRGAVLADLARERFPSPELMERHYLAILGPLQQRLDRPVEPADVLTYGTLPEAPEVSIVVPLYKRIDFLEQQMAQFTSDREIRGADLIYVLDSPELADDLRTIAGDLFAIYRVPYRVAILSRNTGFATANNVGVSLARAPLVLLCNSDVLPDRPGWLGRMAEFYRSTPGIGALAPKLLFEDDSLQHAGLYFRRTEEPGVWENLHYHKGLHRDTPAANVTRRVPAVTAACLMIDRELFRRVGGLRPIFVQGDYEDSDLCLRLAEEGYASWYLAEVELYHLEGQSYPGAARAAASRYNRWLHSRLWGERIERLMEGGGNGGPPRRLATVAESGAGFAVAESGAGPAIEESGAGPTAPPVQAAAAIEILEVLPPSPTAAGVRFHLDRPRAGLHDDKYRFDVQGWILGGERRVEALELRERRWVFRRIPVDKPRPDVAASIPEAGGTTCGFAAPVSVLGLPEAFELSMLAVLEGGRRVPVGALRGRRKLLHPPSALAIKPLQVTTSGRSGSVYLTQLLGAHPEILTYAPFKSEPRLAGYWTQVLRVLSDPSSYQQAIGTVLSSEEWWLGGDHVPVPHAPDPAIQDWLERESVESLAGFCRQRVQEFYRRAAAVQERRHPAYFVEKNPWYAANRSLMLELFPGTREIFLVRDFRDMLCSILAYNDRRQRVSFGRERVESDEEFVAWMRRMGEQMLAAYRERDGDALLVRYEDLIRSPAEVLEGILVYLGLEGGTATAGRMIADAAEATRGMERHHVTSGTVAESIGRWRRDLDERMQEVCREAFQDLLPAFGYS